MRQHAQGRADVAFAFQEPGALRHGFEVAWTVRHVGFEILGRAFAVAQSQPDEASGVGDPRVAWGEFDGRVQMPFGRLEPRQFQVNFAEVVVEGEFVGLRVRAGQKARVRVLQIAFQQVPLPLEPRPLDLFGIRQVGLGVAASHARKHGTTGQQRQGGHGRHSSKDPRAQAVHARGVPRVE